MGAGTKGDLNTRQLWEGSRKIWKASRAISSQSAGFSKAQLVSGDLLRSGSRQSKSIKHFLSTKHQGWKKRGEFHRPYLLASRYL